MTNHESHEYEERRQLGGGIVATSTLRRPGAEPLPLRIKRLTPAAVMPTKAHPTDSGFDIYAAEDVVIAPGETAVIKTGIAIDLPPGYEATIRPRSGITAKTKLRVQLGTIDTSYRGELGVIVDNVSEAITGFDEAVSALYTEISHLVWTVSNKFTPLDAKNPVGTVMVRKGDKLAQLVVTKLPAFVAVEVAEFTGASDRGENGFGSSGVRV